MRSLTGTDTLPGTVMVTAAVPGPDRVGWDEVEVYQVALSDALPRLVSVSGEPAWRREPDTLGVWRLAAQLAVRMVISQHIAPTLVSDAQGRVNGTWRMLMDQHPPALGALERLAGAMPPAAHTLPYDRAAGTVWRPEELLQAFCDAVADLLARQAAIPPRPGRPRARLLPWPARWVEALTDTEDLQVPLRDDTAELLAGVRSWHAPNAGDTGVVEFHLATPEPDDPRGQDAPWTLDFGLRLPRSDEQLHNSLVPAADIWAGHIPGDPDPLPLQETLLRGLGRCARVFEPLDATLMDQAPTSVTLDVVQAWDFIHNAAPLLEGTGTVAVLPDNVSDEPPQLRLRMGGAAVNADDPAALDAMSDLSALWNGDNEVPLTWEVAIGDEVLDDDALQALLSSGTPLVHWKGTWVKADTQLADQVRRLNDTSVPLAEALLYGLAGSAPASAIAGLDDDGPGVELVVEGPLAGLLDRFHQAAVPQADQTEPDGFVGELRPYQHRGAAWLGTMGELGLGGVLADDMGLGKTIQVIAYWLARGKGPYLVVCPTSVVGNWERELERFAPGLPVTRFHGLERPGSLTEVDGVVVTSYGVLRRDPEPLAAVDWDVVAFDEAQHIKNPSTTGAKQARRLQAGQVIALTGTPLENRLAELWSLLDLTNRGLLGNRSQFTHRFVAPIERRRDPQAAARLRRVVTPFILRREKGDPEVASDLPEKIERTVVSSLTTEQAKLYQEAVDRVLSGGDLAEADAMERRGRILALLTTLKQICNHPAQYLKETADVEALAGRSQKLAAAREIISEVVESGQQAVVFTQFVEMGKLLVKQFEADLDTRVGFLHGGVSAAARDRMVADFQGEGVGDVPPVLVVSLRAGGTGLNLTAATHVLHYDRWWNPAVEDQATDRAHRIGQHRMVEVHKLVTSGTVEERVATLLEHKRALADAVVGAGEQWITELGEEELRELVTLSEPGEALSGDGLDDDWGTSDD